jgi:hypothetical protein
LYEFNTWECVVFNAGWRIAAEIASILSNNLCSLGNGAFFECAYSGAWIHSRSASSIRPGALVYGHDVLTAGGQFEAGSAAVSL